MRTPFLVATTALVSTFVSISPTARADDPWALNGQFIAASDGRWAKVDERYQDLPSVRSTWTISSVCNGPNDCHGTITSDQGWTADLRKPNQAWSAEHIVPDWQHCPDGSTSPGRQLFRFWRVDDQGVPDFSGTSPLFTGEDKMLGESGACGVSMWKTVRMPLLIRAVT
jgi:hypothetical protein